MPRLYLELIENKAKIKQELINTEYKPPNAQEVKTENKEIKPPVEEEKDNNSIKDSSVEIQSEKKEDGSKESQESNDDNTQSQSTTSKSNAHTDNSDDLSDRLKQLLQESGSEQSVKEDYDNPKHDREHRKKKHRDRLDNIKDSSKETPQAHDPPTLAQLQAQGHYQHRDEMPDVNYMTKDDDLLDKKRELLFKFDLLHKSYPNAKTRIPEEFNIHSDYDQMHKEYESTVRRLSLDSTVDSYKNYLVYCFMGTEFVLGNFFNFDMEGFTQQQIVSMGSYERLLIELGEKSYVPTGSKWPVELRLGFLVIINAAFFIISKMIMRKTGANFLNMVNGMNNMNANSSQSQPIRKRKMRGPNIDLTKLQDEEPTNHSDKDSHNQDVNPEVNHNINRE